MKTIAQRTEPNQGPFWKEICLWLSLAVAVFIVPGARLSAAETAEEILAAVVKVRSRIAADARTARSLGTEREGSGVVIDSRGLVLTIGYLILEAMEIEIGGPSGKPVSAKALAYDHDTGFGLLRATGPLGVKPMKLGDSFKLGERDRVLVASYDRDSVQGAVVVSRREFAGYWEYLLENAIFTAPPHPNFGGAALIGPDGRLLGIGSLMVQDAMPGDAPIPGNMFVPIDGLKPILADLITMGRSAGGARPWLGIYSHDVGGRVLIQRVSPQGPGDKAGLRPGDIIVGVGGEKVAGLADFYRKVWARGLAGVEVPLSVLQGMRVRDLIVHSSDRYTYLGIGRSH